MIRSAILNRSIALLALITFAQPAIAAPDAAQLAAANAAEIRGAEMYAYDQAAWHATDRFQEDLKRSGADPSLLRGYIVEPGEDGLLKATFFTKKGGNPVAFAIYSVRGSRVEGGGLVGADGNSEMSPLALRMIDARDQAMARMRKAEYGLCSQTPPNTLVLPPTADGNLSVYIMTPSVIDGVYPAGGHYRFDFNAEGRLVSDRRFMKSCFDLRYASREGRSPAAVVLSHLLDPQPTEIHTFVSHYVPVPVMIVTVENSQIWRISKGAIRSSGTVPQD